MICALIICSVLVLLVMVVVAISLYGEEIDKPKTKTLPEYRIVKCGRNSPFFRVEKLSSMYCGGKVGSVNHYVELMTCCTIAQAEQFIEGEKDRQIKEIVKEYESNSKHVVS